MYETISKNNIDNHVQFCLLYHFKNRLFEYLCCLACLIIPPSDAFLLAKKAVETRDCLPLDTLHNPLKDDVNNRDAIAKKMYFF